MFPIITPSAAHRHRRRNSSSPCLFVFWPPVSSIAVPHPNNDTLMLIGLDGCHTLHVLCEPVTVRHQHRRLYDLHYLQYGYLRRH